jgi:hypothetical protein
MCQTADFGDIGIVIYPWLNWWCIIQDFRVQMGAGYPWHPLHKPT